ncbi:hypothetical protein CBFG_01052 [Clostridiales bacterium 1_7_47FAA]|uniref:DUF3899 domain-containing protein n=1 Tax=Enterocloster hominis (ex Hitch et al. 2024) TaxID=1917870 RepID=A0ABV1D2U1_9FIRM|nr:hypothetical protein CBFG_01052 [Clostridiales bacterium 1_7_47FAA]
MGYFWEGQDKWNLNKQNRIIRTYEEPVLPLLCRIIFWSMILLTASMIAVDVSFFIRFDMQESVLHLLSNVAVTGFFAWLFFSAVLIPCSLAAVRQVRGRFMRRTAGDGVKMPGGSGNGSGKPAASKAQAHMEAVYFRYVKIAVGGLGAWGIFFGAICLIR